MKRFLFAVSSLLLTGGVVLAGGPVTPPGVQVVGTPTASNVLAYVDGALIDSGVAPTNLVVVSNQVTRSELVATNDALAANIADNSADVAANVLNISTNATDVDAALIGKLLASGDGAWNQWIHPHASEYGDWIYWGAVGENGDQFVHRRHLYNNTVDSKLLFTDFAKDDHNGVAVNVDTNGIAVFLTGHDSSDTSHKGKCYYGVFSDWNDIDTLTNYIWHVAAATNPVTYNQIVPLAGRYYHFTRQSFNYFHLAYSDDNMQSWSATDRIAGDDTGRRYMLFRPASTNEIMIATYKAATDATNEIRFAKIDTDGLLHYNSTTTHQITNGIPNDNTVWTNLDLVVSASAGEYFRLLDIATNSVRGEYNILYLSHDLTNANYYLAYGDWGSWSTTNLGISGGTDIGYSTYFGTGCFDETGDSLGIYASAYDGTNSTINHYTLDGLVAYNDWTVLSESGKKVRPAQPQNANVVPVLWNEFSDYSHYQTYTGSVAGRREFRGVATAAAAAESVATTNHFQDNQIFVGPGLPTVAGESGTRFNENVIPSGWSGTVNLLKGWDIEEDFAGVQIKNIHSNKLIVVNHDPNYQESKTGINELVIYFRYCSELEVEMINMRLTTEAAGDVGSPFRLRNITNSTFVVRDSWLDAKTLETSLTMVDLQDYVNTHAIIRDCNIETYGSPFDVSEGLYVDCLIWTNGNSFAVAPDFMLNEIAVTNAP